MWNILGKRLQVSSANRSVMALLLLQALLTGLFAGTSELYATVRFIATNEIPDFAIAFMASGALGILITAIYSYLSKQLRNRSWAWMNLVVAMLTMVIIALGFAWAGSEGLETGFYMNYFVFILPLVLVALMSFRVTLRNLLSASDRRQFSGLMGVMLTGGMILGFALAMPLSMNGTVSFAPLMGPLFLLLASLVQLVLFFRSREKGKEMRSVAGSAGPMRLLSHRYTASMTLFFSLGIVSMVLLYFGFLQGTWELGPGLVLEEKTPVFRNLEVLSLFVFLAFSLSTALGWLMRRYAYGMVKRIFGLRATLVLLPVLILAVAVFSRLDYIIDFSGLDDQKGTWLLLLAFFLFRMMKDAVLDPSMGMIMKSLDPRDRENVYAGLEGVFSQVAVLVAGVLLLALFPDNPATGSLGTFPIAVFILVLFWTLSGLFLYRSYHRLLTVTLEKDGVSSRADLTLDDISSFDLSKSRYPMELIAFNPYFFHYYAREKQLELLSHKDVGVRKLVWKHFLASAPGVPEPLLNQLLGNEQDPDVLELIRQLRRRRLVDRMDLQKAFIRERLQQFNMEQKDLGNAVQRAFNSGKKESVFAAINQVALDRDRSFSDRLVELFRDHDPQIQSASIMAAGHLDAESMGMHLVDFLEHPKLYSQAWSTLVRLNGEALDELESAFNKPDVSLKMQKRIISVIAASGGEEGNRHLLQKLDYQHRDIFQSVVQGLYENHYIANDLDRPMIQSAILRMVESGVWTMTARISIRADDPGGALAKVIEHELWEINELILMLLALIYDRASVRRIRGLLIDRSSDDRGMALELLELMLTDSLKPVLTAYFHDISVREKVDKLKGLYPTEIFPADQVLKKILNRNAAQMGDFVRIAVLDLMGKDERYFDEQQIKAQGFHPNPRIRAFAGNLLWRNQPGNYDELNGDVDFPDNQFPGQDNIIHWYMDTTMRLSEWALFENIGINSLFRLVSKLRSYSEEEAMRQGTVCLVRSLNASANAALSDGMAFISSCEPEILEQIRYLANMGASEAFLIDQTEFRELSFDDKSLLHVFCEYLNKYEG